MRNPEFVPEIEIGPDGSIRMKYTATIITDHKGIQERVRGLLADMDIDGVDI